MGDAKGAAPRAQGGASIPLRRDRLDAPVAAFLLFLCLIWALNQVAIKLALPGISPIFLAGIRSVIATGLVWAWATWRGERMFGRDGTLWVGLLTGVLFIGESVTLYAALTYTTASRSIVFLYLSPFVIAGGAHFLIEGERLKRGQVLGLLLAFSGILIAFGDALTLPSLREFFGDLLATIAAVLWGVSTLIVRGSRLAWSSPSKVLFYQLAVTAIALPPLAWAVGEPGLTDPTPLVLGAAAFQTVVVVFFSYLGWFWLVARYPATRISVFSFLTPVLGVAAGGLLLDEPIGPGLLVALGMVGFGIYLVNRSR